MPPCRGKSAVDQVDDLIDKIFSNLYQIVWIRVEANPSEGCSWDKFDFASNCDYLL
jgi:hypothetical protein